MSMAEITTILETSMPLDREQPISATTLPSPVVCTLTSQGIKTVGALLDTDAFRAVTSGRYDINNILAVNGIPISALRWLLNEIEAQYEGSACAV